MVLFLAASTAFAANGETINIGGSVPLVLDLTVTPLAVADNLDLDAGDVVGFNVPIANISIATNNTAGWELWIFSVNSGTLNNSEPTPDTIGYTLSYAGTGGVATTAPTTAGLLFGQSSPPTVDDTTEELSITYNQSTTYAAGYYSDQLTLVLRAK